MASLLLDQVLASPLLLTLLHVACALFAGYWLLQFSMVFLLHHSDNLWTVAKKKAGKALLVIAHPDDECMFFAPTIRALVTAGWQVRLLCLSTGDHEGLGSIRREELGKAATVLGLDQVEVVDTAELRDDPTLVWPGASIIQAVAPHCRDVDWLITFDLGGVSGHANHCALGEALLASHAVNQKLPSTLLVLETLPTLLKYLGPLGLVMEASMLLADVFLLRFLGLPPTQQRRVAFLPWADVRQRARQAMLQHRSQMRWFRHLYILFSRYLHINTLILHQRK